MSAEPIRQSTEPTRQPHDPLVEAHQRQAQAAQRLRQVSENIEKALGRDARPVEFWWQAEDDHEAHFEVYVDPEDSLAIWAVRLLTLDYQQPTREQRSLWESRLQAEFDRQSEVWLKFRSKFVD